MEGHNDELERLYGKFALMPISVRASVFDWCVIRDHLVGMSRVMGDELPYRRTVEGLIAGIGKSVRRAAGSKDLTAFVENEGKKDALTIIGVAGKWLIIHSHLEAMLALFGGELPYRDSVERIKKTIMNTLQYTCRLHRECRQPHGKQGLN